MLAIDLDICNVVLKDSGDIDLGECSFGEDDEQAGLSAGTVTDDHELATNFGHLASQQCRISFIEISRWRLSQRRGGSMRVRLKTKVIRDVVEERLERGWQG